MLIATNIPFYLATCLVRRRLLTNTQNLVCLFAVEKQSSSFGRKSPTQSTNQFTPLHVATDANDESLNRWKASLGLASGGGSLGEPGDKRTVCQSHFKALLILKAHELAHKFCLSTFCKLYKSWY